jgi:phage-related protein
MPRALIVSILGDAKQFGAELDKAAGKTRQMGRVAGVAGIAIAGGLAYGLEKSVKAAMEAQVSTARLDDAFKQSGQSAAAFGGQINTSETNMRSLGFTNTDTRTSLGSLEIATHNARQAMGLLGVSADIARFKSTDLGSATKILTMAMAGSQRATKQLGLTIQPVTSNYDALKATMHGTETAQQKMELAAAKAIDKQATAKEVIALVTEKLHGQADAFSQTAAGGMAQFHAQTTALGENLGKALLPALVMVSGALAVATGWMAQHETVTKIVVIAIGLLAAALLAASVATSIMTAATLAFDIAASPVILVILAVVASLAVLGIAIYAIATHWKEIKTVFVNVWNDIKQVFDDSIAFVKDHWKLFVEALATIIAGPLGLLVAFIATHWATIKQDASDAWDAIKSAVGDAWTGISTRVTNGIAAVVNLVQSLPGKIVNAIGDLSKLLYGAGISIIQGLVDGIKSEFEKAKSFIGGIAHSIASLKGPLDYDRVLLVPHGKAIIEGLQTGMETALPSVYSLAAGIAPKIGTGAAVATGAGGAGANVTINVGPVHGSADQAFAYQLRDELVAIGRREKNIFGGFA